MSPGFAPARRRPPRWASSSTVPASCAIGLRPNAPTRLGSSRAPVAKVGCGAAPRTGAGASDRDDRTRWVEEICRRAKRESRVRFSGAGRWRHGESRSRRCRLPGVRRHASRRFSVDRRLIPQRPADAPLRGQVGAPSASHSRKWRGHGRGDGQSSGVFRVSLGPRPRARADRIWVSAVTLPDRLDHQMPQSGPHQPERDSAAQ